VTSNEGLEALLRYLKTQRGFDFTGYKRSSLTRRLTKRMTEVKVADGYAEYQDYLEVHPEEFTPLFNTVLINVTSFFRDPDAWEALARVTIPAIIAGKMPGEPIRICSVGCASGEEPYSVAMLLAEALGDKEFRARVKIYATDVDHDALATARHAVYSAKALEAVPEPLRGKYFEPVPAHQFTIRPDLRRAVIFGRHDLIQDAPISRLDLLICRNTLMYFNAETQGRILARFHFALAEHGFLFLGKSEMLVAQSDLYSIVDLKSRIFAKVAKANLRDRLLALTQAGDSETGNQLGRQVRLRELAFDVTPLAQFVVDLNGQLVLASGQARHAFGIGGADIGKPLQDLEISFRPVELRSLIQKAYAERIPVALNGVKCVDGDGGTTHFDVQVTPLAENGSRALGVAIMFTDVTRSQQLQDTLQHAKEELETTNEELQSTNEELETTNEELQSTNEELETTNEELQSTNEELETMNEELQATNEELETTNDELQVRTEENHRATMFLHSVLSTLHIGVAVLDQRLEVRSWNAMAEELWGLRADEVQGQSVFNLDIGLPLDPLRAGLKAALARDPAAAKATIVEAVNRRGKAIRCRVAYRPFSLEGDEPGVILAMEALP